MKSYFFYLCTILIFMSCNKNINKQSGNNPTLIRIETDVGHGAGTPISKTIAQYSDIFGFTLFNMGYTELPLEQK